MSRELYYFSGTGNSLAVAQDLSERTGAKLIAIPALMDRARIVPGGESVGLVFPVYHKGIPLILKRFVDKLAEMDNRYLFGVCTYGDTSGLAIRDLRELVQSRGGQLAAGFGVQMPYNYLTPSPVLKGFFSAFKLREIPIERQEALFASAKEKVAQIAAFVTARKLGVFETTSDILTRLADRFNLEENLSKAVWLKIAGVEGGTNLSFLESRQLMDQAFYTNAQCNGCGICARICPVGDIHMVDGRPVWQQRCEQCFACLQWCPQEAIQFGSNTAGGKRYHHPDINLAEMLP